MEFVTLSEEVFESFSSASPYANLWQSIDMAEMKRKNDMTTHYVGLMHNGEAIAAALLCSRKVVGSYREFTAPRGFLIDYHNLELLTQFLQALKTYIKQHRGIYFSTDPYLAYQQHALDGSVVEGGWNNRPVFERFIKQGFTHGGFTAGIDLTKEPRWIYTIPLTGHTPETLLASFERKCKRSIQKTIKYQLHVETLDANSLDVFFDVMEHTATRRDFKNRDKQYYYQLLESFGNRGHLKYLSVSLDVAALLVQLEAELALEQNSYDVALQKQTPQHHNEKLTSKLEQIQARITSCHKKIAELEALSQQKGATTVIASGVFFLNGSEILCLFSGVYDEYMPYAAPYALHWEMMKYGLKNNYQRYNLYGISGIFDSSAPDFGVYEFKRGFQGEVVELLGTFTFIPNPVLWNSYRTLRRIKHTLSK